MSDTKSFKIFDVKNALFDYECERLIELYNTKHIEYLTGFYGFDVEYIIKRIEDITVDLTGIDVLHQEPIYLTKTTEDEPNRIDAWEKDNNNVKHFGNRKFTLFIPLTTTTINFPNINLQHKLNPGDAIIWNNIDETGERIPESIFNISPNTTYIKTWTREKIFVY